MQLETQLPVAGVDGQSPIRTSNSGSNETQHLAVVSNALQLAVYTPETDPGGIQEARISPQHVILHCVCLDAQIPVPSPGKGLRNGRKLRHRPWGSGKKGCNACGQGRDYLQFESR